MFECFQTAASFLCLVNDCVNDGYKIFFGTGTKVIVQSSKLSFYQIIQDTSFHAVWLDKNNLVKFITIDNVVYIICIVGYIYLAMTSYPFNFLQI